MRSPDPLIYSLQVRDVWFYSTVMADSVAPLLTGTPSAVVEPLLAGLIAFCVQGTLAFRGSRVSEPRTSRLNLSGSLRPQIVANPTRRLVFIVLMGLLIINAFVGSILACIWSIHFQKGGASSGFLHVDFPGSLSLWMWSTCVADAVITGTCKLNYSAQFLSCSKADG